MFASGPPAAPLQRPRRDRPGGGRRWQAPVVDLDPVAAAFPALENAQQLAVLELVMVDQRAGPCSRPLFKLRLLAFRLLAPCTSHNL